MIITVPHASGCDPTGLSHICDYSAQAMATTLSKALTSKGIPHNDPFISLIGRRELRDNEHSMDMNRKWNRDSPYRINIRDAILRAKMDGYLVWVIDVHSFPPEYKPFSGSEKKEDQNDFIVLDTAYYEKEQVIFTPYVERLVELMNTRSVKTELLEGAHPHHGVNLEATNDIMDTSRALGAKSFLIEANESIKQKKMRDASEAIADFIKEYK